MYPSSSGNSRTSSEAWSAFASRAASSEASPPPRRSTSFATRSAFSTNEPAPAKNVIVASRWASASIPTATSRSNVKDASSTRASSTWVGPAATTSRSPPFATTAKRFPPTGKYRWCDCMVVMITRSGSWRKRSSKLLSSTMGFSTRKTTSSSTPPGSLQPPIASSPSTIRRRRSSAMGSTSAARRESTYAAAVRISTAPWVKRWPNEVSPTIVSASSLASTQRTGRAKRIPLSSQRMDFVNDRPRTIRSTCSGRLSRRSRPGMVTPRKPSFTSSSSTETPCFLAKPAAARSRRFSGGPLTHSSAVLSGRSSTRKASRLGPMKSSDGVAPICARARSGSCADASRQARAGSSSAPISSSSDGIFLFLGHEIGGGNVTGQVADPSDVRGALGHGKRSARVQQVERVGALEHLVVGGDRQRALEQVPTFGLVLVEATSEHVDRRFLEVVPRPLALAFAVDVAPGDARCPLEVECRPFALQEHGQPFEPVGHLGGNELDVEASQLLEIRPLRDLHPVAPDLPSEPPGAERRLLPVVLDEPHVVAA